MAVGDEILVVCLHVGRLAPSSFRPWWSLPTSPEFKVQDMQSCDVTSRTPHRSVVTVHSMFRN